MTDPTFADRQTRYEQVKAMRAKKPPMTLAQIGATFDPPIGKERVRQILAAPPKPNGRPPGPMPKRRATLEQRLAYWENRLARTTGMGRSADRTRAEARERIAATAREMAALGE